MARNTLVLLVVGTVTCFLCSTSSAEVPHMINYQGKLTTASGGCLNDTVQMTFSIYPDTLGSPADWTETQFDVVVKEGVFSVILGSVNHIPGGDTILDGSIKYLGVQVESDPEMRPLKPMVSVAYAFRSAESDTAGFALSAAPDDDWDIDTAGLNIYRLTGDVGIGTPSPQYKLDIRGTTGIDVGINFSDVPLTISVPSDQSALISRIAKGGSIINVVDADGNVGIGTFSPQEKLDVAGTAQVTGFKMPTAASNGYVLTSDASGVGTWQPGGGGPGSGWVDDGLIVRLQDSTDYVSIGTKNNPGYSKLFLSHDYHQLALHETDAAADEKNWCIDADNGDFAIWAVDDAFGGWTSVMYVDRVGNAPERVIFQGKFGMGDSYPDARLEVSAEGGADDLLMLSSNDDSDGDRFTVKNSGNVGIGTSSPQYKLDVRGTTGIDVGSYSGDIPLTINVPSDQSALISRIAKGGSVINVVDSDGNVGIGTFSPQEKLDVAGTARVTGFKMPTGASNSYVLTSDASGVGTWQPAGGGIGGSGTVNYLSKFTGSTTIGNSLIFDNGSNVGIGTTSPSFRLTLSGGTGNVFGVDNNVCFVAKSTGGTYQRYLWPRAGDNSMYLLYGQGLYFKDDDASGTTTMFLTQNGKVGIGTTNPYSKLHVEDASNVEVYVEATTNGDANFVADGSSGRDGGILFREGGSNKWWIRNEGDDDSFRIFKYAATAGDVLAINSAGYVGIGTTTPAYKLEVNGDINVSGSYNVKKGGVNYTHPDYVFEPDYELMPLGDLKEYVRDYKSLPNVVTAEEVKQNEGFKMDELLIQMLEKIEEQTLYIFELEERIAELEKKQENE